MTATLKQTIRNPAGYDLDYDLLQEFENDLNPAQPEKNKIPSRVLGYGEISTVFEIQTGGFADLALKRMSIFEAPEELETYLTTYDEYHRLLEEEIGIHLPTHGYTAFMNKDGRPIFYIIQQKVAADTIGNTALTALSTTEASTLFQQVLQEMGKVWTFNQAQEKYQVALDGQISNWAVVDFDPAQSTLLYLDTSTPIYRIQGREQLNSELFLRSAPSFLRWILRRFILEDVVNRYYDVRQVVVDLLANLYKEQLPHLVPDFIPLANNFFDQAMAGLNLTQITEDEVQAYYREDKFIWSLYASMRRLDRFLQTNLLRKQYPYILPGKVKR
jgi:hypothetical protein